MEGGETEVRILCIREEIFKNERIEEDYIVLDKDKAMGNTYFQSQIHHFF